MNLKNILFLSIGLLVGGLIVFTVSKSINRKAYFVEQKSKYDFDETVAQFEAMVNDTEGWKILHTYDLQKSMEKQGYNVLQVKVFSVCNPAYSSKILFSSNERVASSLMPCRVSIYQKSNGKTYIARLNSEQMGQRIGGLINEVMSKASNDIDTIISDLIVE